jgi:hypothetical protein
VVAGPTWLETGSAVIEVGEDAGGTLVRYGTTRAGEGEPVGEPPTSAPTAYRAVGARARPPERSGDYLLAGSFSGS